MRLELEVWREACRHIEIDDALARLVPLMTRRFHQELILIRRVELDRGRLDTVATGPASRLDTPLRARTDCTPEEVAALTRWFRAEPVLHARAGTEDLLEVLAVPGIRGDCLVGPLLKDHEPVGIVLLASAPDEGFTEEHRTLLHALLEPFTVALENDRRLHELARLKEAVEADNRALLSRLGRKQIVETVVGEASGLRSVMERVDQVAPTDAPVLILGETGSGKEVVARAIHTRSRRASNPIVRVNCGAIPPELVDSELFGHERGSFTGAVSQRKGWFERADGGTLFLDEVAELPLAAQVRLLRILQDGTLERVGGQRPLVVDVRIVAATHRDLQAMVATGAFRQDLWYRISVFPIRIPPLRERLEDIPALAHHFSARSGLRLGGKALEPSVEDLRLLRAEPWAGNVRELAAVIERAVILGDGVRLELGQALAAHHRMGSLVRAPDRITLPEDAVVSPTARVTAPALAQHATGAHVSAGFSSLDLAMIKHIEDALVLSGGRIEGPHGAARLLGINPHTLRARMRKLGLDWTRHRVRHT